MNPSESEQAFRSYCSTDGISLESCSPDDAIRAMLGFYRGVRCEDVDLGEGGDMLLYQYGTYGFSPPPTFQFNLTRQFSVDESDEDEGISQLPLTLHYPPSPELDAMKANRWCRSLDQLAAFEAFVRSSDAFRAVHTLTPAEVEVYWEQV